MQRVSVCFFQRGTFFKAMTPTNPEDEFQATVCMHASSTNRSSSLCVATDPVAHGGEKCARTNEKRKSQPRDERGKKTAE